MTELYHGDAIKTIKSIGGVYDALITDPPYASGATLAEKAQSTAQKYTSTKNACPYPDFDGDAMDQRSWTHLMGEILRDARGCCVPGAVCVAFIDWRNLPALTDAMQWAGWIWRGIAVWDKLSCRPQRGRYRQQAEFILWGSNGKLAVDRPVPVLPGVYQYSNVQPGERLHQTQKPLTLMRELVRICVPGGRILDPFAGSGTTLEAARLEGYEATGIEANTIIAQLAAQRLGIPLRRL